jgi:hypothetical protein
LYVNGEKKGTGSDWGVTDTYAFSVPNRGRIVVAIDAQDAELDIGAGVGALLAEVTVGANIFSSDDSWKCWATGQTGSSAHNIDPPAEWERTYFDDSGWQNAVMHAGPRQDPVPDSGPDWGYGPDDSCNGCNNVWNHVHNGGDEGISSSAHWIWTHDHDAHNDVFCRFQLDVGSRRPPPPPPTTSTTARVRLGLGHIVALYRRSSTHPLHTRFANIFGPSLSEATMRPNPRSGATRRPAPPRSRSGLRRGSRGSRVFFDPLEHILTSFHTIPIV